MGQTKRITRNFEMISVKKTDLIKETTEKERGEKGGARVGGKTKPWHEGEL